MGVGRYQNRHFFVVYLFFFDLLIVVVVLVLYHLGFRNHLLVLVQLRNLLLLLSQLTAWSFSCSRVESQ